MEPKIDYGMLQSLVTLSGLGDRTRPEAMQAHRDFMNSIFSAVPNSSQPRPRKPKSEATLTLPSIVSSAGSSSPPKSASHALVTPEAPIPTSTAKDTFMTALRKLPHLRSREDVRAIIAEFKRMRHLAQKFSGALLAHLAESCLYEAYSSAGFRVPVDDTYYYVLRGSVQLIHARGESPAVNFIVTDSESNEYSVRVGDMAMKGDVFGHFPGIPCNVNSAETKEFTEFIAFKRVDAERAVQLTADAEYSERIGIVCHQQRFHTWPRRSLQMMIKYMRWIKVNAGETIVNQGTKCPYIAFIHKGSCAVLRQVPVKQGRGQRSSLVAVATLGVGSLFGTRSVLHFDLFELCTFVATTKLHLLVLDPEIIPQLDQASVTSLGEEGAATYDAMTQEDVESIHAERVRIKEWEQFKLGVVSQVKPALTMKKLDL